MKKLRPALIEPLEPRLLLSADLPGVLIEASPVLLPASGAVTQRLAMPADPDASLGAPALYESRNEIAFVDAGVDDYQTLVADLRKHSGDRVVIDVVVLDRDRDGVEQIRDALHSRAQDGERFDAVHVFSHGNDAGIQLGDTWLSSDSLAARAGLVAEWGAALTNDADLLLYGCNLASSAEGQDLVSSLAVLTGADVAASVDATGAAILGGDWDLEYATGPIENAVAASAAAQTGWAGVLDGTAIASVSASPTPIARPFVGISFGASGPTSNVGGPWEVMAGAEAPTRDEKIVVGLDGGGNLSGQIWNGTSWSAFAFNDIATGLETDLWGFDVAYESTSGDAVMVYANGTTGTQGLSYRVWNGTSWSGPIAMTTPLTGQVEQLNLAANPLSDEMVLVATMTDKSDFALVWDGSSWGNSLVLPLGNTSTDTTDTSVVYQQQSGRALLVYGGFASPLGTYTWNGSIWAPGPIAFAPAGSSGLPRWTTLASDPNSDQIALGVITSNRYVWLSVWNGTNWAPSVLASPDAPHNDRLGVAVAFESLSGDAIATYAVNDNFVHYRTWSATGGWSADKRGPNFGRHSDVMTLDAGPETDTVMLSVVTQDRTLRFLAWNGTSWGTPGFQVASAGVNNGQPFLFLWDQNTSMPNQAPVLAPAAPALPPITEDDVASPGVLVSAILGASVSDPDAGALEGIAITALASGNGAWQYSTDGGSIWSAIGPVTPASALLLRDTDKVRFLPDAQNGTTASFTYRAWDRTTGSAGGTADASSGGGSKAYSAATDTASIVVSAVNDAPVLDPSGAMTLTNVIENHANPPGSGVSAILLSAGGDRVTDVDQGALEGLAIVGVDDSNGSWQYSTNGGALWTPFGVVSTTSAVLLDANDRVRFVPAPSYGGPAGNIAFHAWDRSSGTSGDTGVNVSLRGGTTAFSLASETATLDVIPVNDAPDLNPMAPVLTPITEDDLANGGQTVASIVGASITDLDPGALEGIAVTALASGNGTWQFSTNGGTSWNDVGTVSDAQALLLRDVDSIRFVPDGANADAASLGYRAWDQSSGSAGSKTDVTGSGGTGPFSSLTDTASIAVTAVNDAPVLDASGAMTLDDITEDDASPTGNSVASVLASAGGDRLTDVDTGALEGIAVIGVDDGNGTWEYSTDGGGLWHAFGTVSDASAVLLNTASLVRFVPAPDYDGSAGSLAFRGWDQTAGSNGQTNVAIAANGTTTAFSLATATATLDVGPANDAPVLVPSAPALPTLTEDDTANAGVLISSLLGTSVTDVDTGALEGIAITGLVGGNGSWEYSTDDGASWSAIGPVSTASALLLRDSDLVRFIPDGQNATTASFSYRAWDQSSGAAEDRTDVTAAGGASAFSLATDTAAIVVTARNDAPVLLPSAPTLPTITEDDTANGGVLVSSLLGSSVTDVDTGALEGIAITGLASGNGTWQFSTDGGGSWSAAGPVTPASALLLRDTDRVRFVPDAQNATAASFSYRAWDQSVGTAGTTANAATAGGTRAFSLASDTASIAVTARNDAPVLTPSAPTLPTITENDIANGGVLVSSLLGGSVTDVDTGAAEGIAITGLASGNGTWQYSTNGGGSWSPVGPVTPASALLLRDIDRVRFVPNAQNATTASFSYRAWDQSVGAPGTAANTTTAGGTSAFSLAIDTAAITVTARNDAPVLTPSAPTLPTITEDDTANAGVLVSSLLGSSVIDVDTGAIEGIAITGLASGSGTWQYSTNAGSSWSAVSPVSPGSALLLRDSDRIRFVPDAQNATAASFSYRAWDQSVGTAGTTANAATAGGTRAFSLASDTASIAVTERNDAPVLTPSAPTLPTITEDETANPGVVVSSLLGGVSDVDAGALEGIAITGLASGNGTWQYSTDGGGSWSAAGPVTPASALLLRDTDRVRFVPNAQNATAASFSYRAWDQSVGVPGTAANTTTAGGTSAFSLASDTAAITVTARNDAPVLTPSAPTLPTITEDDTANAGVLVSSLLGGSVTDVDTGAVEGIAITGLASGNGTWQFSTDGGGSWGAVGPVTPANALLLRDSDQIRFLPDGQNATAASFSYRAWDQSVGVPGTTANATAAGGTGAFSLATETASIAVAAVNDAPVLAPSAPTLPTITEDDTTNAGVPVSSLLGGVSDVDTGALEGIAITGLASGNGIWQYSTDGGGSWSAVGPVTPVSALLLRDSDLVRFIPDGQNATAASFSYRAWDQSSGAAEDKTDVTAAGGTSAFSLASDTAAIAVTTVNDAPVLAPSAPTLPTITEDETANPGVVVSSLLGGVSDVDAGALEGIAIIGLASGNGTWQFSTDDGGSWSAVGLVTPSNALLLRDSDLVRLIPDGQNATAASFSYRAWDQSVGVPGTTANATAAGGTGAFSLATETASIAVAAVNDAPVLAPSAPTLPTITEDETANPGVVVSSLLGGVSDVDTGALEGIAITGLASGNGTWQFSTDGGGSWSAASPVSPASALLLRDSDRIRFVPDAQNVTAASFSYRGWDRSVGTAGTKANATTAGGTGAFSLATGIASIAVTARNDAPVLTPSAPTLPTITEDDVGNGGVRVSSLLGSAVSDVDVGALEGIAITGLISGNGTWQFSTDGGGLWSAVGPVTPASALLLRDSDRVRFVPDAQNATAAAFSYRAWDQSVGVPGTTANTTTAGGASAFSLAIDTAAIAVTARNDAPVLTPSAPTLPTITEDDTANAGVLVSSLLDSSVTDVDMGALEGIAITGLTSGNGTWQYSTNNGGSWSGVGRVSTGSALLLRDVDRVRFVPDAQNGTAAAFSFRAWDQTSGSASDTFSAASDTGSITVTALNDAPRLAGALLPPVIVDASNPPGLSVAALFAGRFSDVDDGSFLSGVAVVGNGERVVEGTWQYSTDGGATWVAIGSVADGATALVLGPSARLRFLAAPDFSGAPAGLDVRALDDSYAGGFSSVAGGVETRAVFDTSRNGGVTAVAASATSLATRVDPEIGVTIHDSDLEPTPTPPVGSETPLAPPQTDDPAIVSTPELVTLELETNDPDVFEPDEPVPIIGIAGDLATPAVAASSDEVTPLATAQQQRNPTSFAENGFGEALKQLLRSDLGFLDPGAEFANALDRLRREAREYTLLEQIETGSSLVLSAGFSIGYVIWLTRGGLLLASLTSSMPVWRLIDPIPILASLATRSEDDHGDDESLNSLVNTGRKPEESAILGRKESRVEERSES